MGKCAVTGRRLKLFFKWVTEFDEKNPFIVQDNGSRQVEYADKKEIMDGIIVKYHPETAKQPQRISDPVAV